MTYRQHHSVALDIQDDFEHVHHPRNELPLTMEDTTRRRYPHSEKTDLWHIDNGGDDDSKDVYSKAKAGFHTGRLGPVRRQQPPPSNMASTPRIHIHIHTPANPFPPDSRPNLSSKTAISCRRHCRLGRAHFGKFGSHYLKREFYFDVHPPWARCSSASLGFPFVTMRVMLALFGVAMVPLAWFTAKELRFTNRACHLVTIMTLCDLAWLCISRFILLDSMLLFFTFTTVFCLTKFVNQQYQSFSFDWWLWLAATGWSIGCVCSVKWVGFFATALVGAYTIEDLWDKFGDLKMPVRTYIKHWIARGLCLIVLPMLIYMASFKIHFLVLNHSGPGDAQMSSLFQANLVGNDFAQNPLGKGHARFQSDAQKRRIRRRSPPLTRPNLPRRLATTASHMLPLQRRQQPLDVPPTLGIPDIDPNGELVPLKHAAVVRLQHTPTTRNLHSHTVTAPVTKSNYEVSCYGNTTVGDSHDHWVVEVVDDLHRGRREKVDRIHSLTTRLRFKHQSLGCYLRAANAVLPQWGFKQIEVSCVKENDESDTHTYWNVESHWNSRLPPGNAKLYSSPFLRDFWHLNVAMMTSNNALVPDPDKEDILASKPTEWPFLHVGLRMCGWGDDQPKYYLLGHPIVWWSGSLALGLSLLATGVYLLRAQRKYVDFGPGEWDQFSYVTKLAFFGWVFHFMPFLIMGRVTYIHHYLPALWFSVLMVGHLFNHFVFAARIAERTKWIVFGAAVSVIVGVFWWFRGIAFGITGPIKDYWGLAWRKTWNIY
ncbi:MIR domain [Rhizoctonia solani]|uniref:Dolichyl-phosphate-mannose--protein mannosyltransferase n=1 Tax=Rhizoctonia solani TaxID=456999 RepID=A0A8H7M4L4_9AGAM|nr:MIR domain [Rhizoctonia solani]